MKNLLLFIFLFLAQTSYGGEKPLHEIKEIYIESNGNNKFEAKIKAHEQGMRRALAIIADREGIAGENIQKAPYYELKKVFEPAYMSDVIETEELYSALINYKYKLFDLNKLLYKYGDTKVIDRFYEYVIFPVFKQRNNLSLWDGTNIWNKKWALKRENLEKYKLLFPKPNKKLMEKITANSVFKLSFDELQEIFSSVFFKKALIITIEFFTDQANGDTIMILQNIIVEHNEINKIISKEYTINRVEDIPLTFDRIIAETRNQYGIISKKPNNLDNAQVPTMAQGKLKNGESDDMSGENTDMRLIQLNVDIYNAGELKEVKQKLDKVAEIDKYEVREASGGKYKIAIWTRYSDFNLAEGFYVNGLSFKIYNNLYNLIDIKDGG